MARLLKIFFSFSLLSISGCELGDAKKHEDIYSPSSQSYTPTVESSQVNSPNRIPNTLGLTVTTDAGLKTMSAASINGDSPSWDIDKNGQADALTDGLLMLRYSFGLRGESLLTGAVSGDSSLSNAEVISEIESTYGIADIDGDGRVDALTDGLILLRYLFGLRSESLITGAISTGASRVSVNAITQYLDGYMPALTLNPSVVTLSGRVTFDLIPFESYSDSLDYSATYASAARGVLVEALDNAGNVVISGNTDADGNYSFDSEKDLELRVRVSAKMRQTTDVEWDISVLDNTSTIGGDNPLYVSDSASFIASQNIVKNIHLPSGRDGQNSGVRSAAPFAILDIIYDSMQQVVSVEPGVNFPPLAVYWSPANNPSEGSLENGDLGSSFFQTPNLIYILGSENSDADEYDRHVIAHEWIHYFEHNFSRSDSLGGPHSQDDRLDMRVAYSEGLANALSGIITGDSVYRDSNSFWPYFGWSMNFESNYSFNPGWFSESSVQSIIYDLYDTQADGIDSIALGFEPIYTTLTSPDYINDDYLISMFSFANYLKNQRSSEVVSQIDGLLSAQQIYGTGTDGLGETNNGGIGSVLPIYNPISANNGSTIICYNNSAGALNKLGNRAYLLFNVSGPGIYRIELSPAGIVSATLDADLVIFKSGRTIGRDYSAAFNGSASLYVSLSTGKHIIEAGVWDIEQTTPMGNYCFNVQITN